MQSGNIAENHVAYRQDFAVDSVRIIDVPVAFDGIAAPLFINGCHLNDQGHQGLVEALTVTLAPSLP
jgi:hypothetical protein